MNSLSTASRYQTLELSIQDQRSISLRVFTALGEPRALVIIAGAMGVPQGCYEKFATFLQSHGLTVITFDYFGTGDSLQGHLRDCQTDLMQWAEHDCSAVIRYAREHYPQLDIHWVGHSVGGQLLGLIPEVNQLSKAVTITSGSGYWRQNSAPTRRIVWLLWFFIAPVSVRLLGYYPGGRLKMVGDLPAQVMRQWRSWCLNPEYMVGVEGQAIREKFDQVKIPIHGLAFTDDEMLSPLNIKSLHRFFTQAEVDLKFLAPKEVGEKRIGHLGWFRERYKESIWKNQLLPLLNS